MCRLVGVDPSASSSSSTSSSFTATNTTAGGGVGAGAVGGGVGGGEAGGGDGSWLGLGLGNLLKGSGGKSGEQARERSIEIATRVVEICRTRRAFDGGFTPLSTILSGVASGSGRGYEVGGEMADVSSAEVVAAIEGLGVLRGGFAVLGLGGGGRGGEMVRSVPKELSEDQGRVLEAVAVLGRVSVGVLVDNLGWGAERAGGVCADLVGEGVVWVDDQGGGGREYWGTGGLGGWED